MYNPNILTLDSIMNFYFGFWELDIDNIF